MQSLLSPWLPAKYALVRHTSHTAKHPYHGHDCEIALVSNLLYAPTADQNVQATKMQACRSFMLLKRSCVVLLGVVSMLSACQQSTVIVSLAFGTGWSL